MAISTPSRATLVTLTGIGAALVTVTIWAVWLVGMRQAMNVHLPVASLGLIRFGVPALLLAPFWWRYGLLPSGLDKRLLGMMVAGAGAPFFVIVAFGAHHAMAGEVGVLLGGTMPLFVALFAAFIDRERFGGLRLAGLGLIGLATLLIGGSAMLAGLGGGRLAILAGAALWAVYTLAFRRSGLTPLAAAGLVGAWSSLVLLPFAIFVDGPAILAADPRILAGQVLSQGILSGVVALVCYGAAVARLGASRAVVITALAPPLAALIAVPVLGEVPGIPAIAGIIAAVAGVVLASGAVKLSRVRFARRAAAPA